MTIPSVVANGLCSGCGACAYAAPGALEMVDVPAAGLRPQVKPGVDAGDARLREAVAVCPGVGLSHDYDASQPGLVRALEDAWGPVLGVYEGYAADDAIRFAGSSGGAASALALYCLERAGMAGVLHTAAREDAPHRNETVLSTTRDELLARTGSRYAPASPCDGLQRIEDAAAPCVFIGKPCDVAAVGKARRLRPALDAKVGLTIAFFCAGTPSTAGTLAMLARMGVPEPAALVSLRYRGNGWPGEATAVFRDGDGTVTRTLTYAESWGEVLAQHQQWRCKVCADHTGEFADIAVGDPWYREIPADEPGRSLILARTARGKAVLEEAIAAGFLVAAPADPGILPRSQPNLLRTRGAVWGRIVASRVLGAAAPRYRRMPMFRHWLQVLTLRQKAQSLGGTMQRIMRRGRLEARG